MKRQSIYLLLLVLQSGRAREVNEAAVLIYKRRIQEYYLNDRNKEAYGGMEALSEPPFAFDSLKKDKLTGLEKLALKLSKDLMDSWKNTAEFKKYKLLCSKIELFSEIHTCPSCSIEKENRADDAVAGKVILAAEGVGIEEPSTLQEYYFDWLFPLLRKYNSKELQTPIYGIENRQLFAIEGVFSFDDAYSNLAKDKTRLKVDMNSFSLANNQYYEVEMDILNLATGFIYGLLRGDSGRRKEFLAYLKGQAASTLFTNAFNKVIQQTQGKDLDSEETKQWFLDSGFKEFLSEFTYSDLKIMFDHAMNFYLKNRLLETIQSLGISEKTALDVRNFIEAANDANKYVLSSEIIRRVLRNIAFATNAIKLCADSKSSGKPLVIHLGAAHLSAVKYLLSNAVPSFDVKSYPVEKAYESSTSDDATQMLNKKIQSIKADQH